MDSKKAKSLAKETLKGNWGKFAGATLVYSLILIAFNYIPRIGLIIIAILMPVLSFGLLKMLVDIKNGEYVDIVDFFTTGFKFFRKSLGHYI